MGNSQTGGGGSVQWEITAKKMKRYSKGNNGKDFQNGADNIYEAGKTFRLSVGMTQAEFDSIIYNGGRLEVEFAIEPSIDQINIDWPDA